MDLLIKDELIVITIFFIAIQFEPLIPACIFVTLIVYSLWSIVSHTKVINKAKRREKELKVFDDLIKSYLDFNKDYEKETPYIGFYFQNNVIAIRINKWKEYGGSERCDSKISKFNYCFSDHMYCNDPEKLKYVLLIEDNTSYWDEQLIDEPNTYSCTAKLFRINPDSLITVLNYESQIKEVDNFRDDLNCYQKQMLKKISNSGWNYF
jgi:hypothetical protein